VKREDSFIVFFSGFLSYMDGTVEEIVLLPTPMAPNQDGELSNERKSHQ
jgi:hypothetical protein